MVEDRNLITAAETAAILRHFLGRERQWRDFLSDCIRDRTNLHGQTLMPYAAVRTRRAGRRPIYMMKDIAAFIVAVRAANSSLQPEPFSGDVYTVDTTPGLHWTTRVAKPDTRGGASL